jgi:hypothetical protein
MNMTQKTSPLTILKNWKLVKIGMLGLCLFFQHCRVDELPEPAGCASGIATYEFNIRPIIEESCAYSGCHDGNNVDAPGDFETYQGMLPFLRDGTVRARVTDLRFDPVQGMPPSIDAYPQTEKENLTDKEFELIRCWLNNGFPQR